MSIMMWWLFCATFIPTCIALVGRYSDEIMSLLEDIGDEISIALVYFEAYCLHFRDRRLPLLLLSPPSRAPQPHVEPFVPDYVEDLISPMASYPLLLDVPSAEPMLLLSSPSQPERSLYSLIGQFYESDVAFINNGLRPYPEWASREEMRGALWAYHEGRNFIWCRHDLPLRSSFREKDLIREILSCPSAPATSGIQQ